MDTKIRDVLRLKFESGVSERVIARSMSLSKGSVNAYLQRARVAGLRWPLPDDLKAQRSRSPNWLNTNSG